MRDAAWPHVDEDIIAAAKDQFKQFASRLRDVVAPAATRQKMKLAENWQGSGAQAADEEAAAIVNEHEHNAALADDVARHLAIIEAAVAGFIGAKNLANRKAEEVQKICDEILNRPWTDEEREDLKRAQEDREKEADAVAEQGYLENVKTVSDAAISLGKQLRVPDGTPGADGKVPPEGQAPAAPKPVQEGLDHPGGAVPVAPTVHAPFEEPGGSGGQVDMYAPGGSKAEPAPRPAPTSNDGRTPRGQDGPAAPAGSSPEPPESPTTPSGDGGVPGLTPSVPTPSGGLPATPSTPAAPSPTPLSGGGSKGPAQAGLSGQSTGDTPNSSSTAVPTTNPAASGVQPKNPLEQFQQGLADAANTGGSPQTTSSAPSQPLGGPPTTQPLGGPPPTAGPAAPPAAGGGAPAHVAQAAAGPGGAGPAPVAPPPSGGVPSGAVPLGPPPTPPPAAPVTTPSPAAAPPIAPPGGPAGAAGGGGAQVAPIPVSAARAERDAAQRAVRRSGVDPMENARRIAAALNAPGMANEDDFMFFWVTALTVDGKIVVSNNYGLAYIPEQVRLPEQVYMASADESISPADRASWVNHPIVAVQRWAQHHDTELRAVIATEEQLQHKDAGVHHEVLRPEDIPANGKMAGRDRLQVIAPHVAGQLSRIADADLVKVLPPASADENPPEDRRLELWDEVWQPLTSRASDTAAVHLQAFLAYAVHAQEHAIYAAHTAADPEFQRRAVSDFIYWQHVGQLVADAIAA